MNKTCLKSIRFLFLAVSAIVAFANIAPAATFTITTTSDSGSGSLRQALIEAATNVEGDLITFNIPISDPGFDPLQNRFTILPLTRFPDLPLGALVVTNNQLQGLTIRGDGTFRIFTLVNSAVVTLNNITVSNGGGGDNGVGFAAGGTGGFGGGIYMGDSSTLVLNECVVSDNVAAVAGGGIYLNDSATLTLERSTVRNNTAIDGGGIFVGISGTLNTNNSTFNGNAATTGNGGALFNGVSGTITAMTNTLDGNSAGGDGGGVYNNATITLTSNTVTSNTAGRGGGVFNNFVATLNNNLVALNTAGDGTDLVGRSTLGNGYSGGFNLIGVADGSEGVSDAPNRVGSSLAPINPVIGALQNNGGLTDTRALLPGSPALDKGNSPVLVLDQRGSPRPFEIILIPNETGDGADIGAFEGQFAPTAANASVSGRVTTAGATPISNAIVSLTDSAGNVRNTRTNSFGVYLFSNVPSGGLYVLNARHKGDTFEARLVDVVDDLFDLDIVALP